MSGRRWGGEIFLQDAARGRELALDVGQHRDRQALEVVVVDERQASQRIIMLSQIVPNAI